MRFAAIVVTYNRLEKLKKTLTAYESQTVPFDDIVVVDNNSSDGTKEFLARWNTISGNTRRHVLLLKENVGGSGGFYAGEEFALTLKPDWISVGDDDAYPHNDYLEKAKSFIMKNKDGRFAAICGKVLNIDGSIDLGHRSNFVKRPIWGYPRVKSKKGDYSKEFFSINMFSYVGTFMNVDALNEKGLCNKNLFIYADDAEHSLRLEEYGQIVCVPDVEILHDSGQTTAKNNQNILISWRDYYAIRNQLLLFWNRNKLATFYFVRVSFVQCLRAGFDGIKLFFTALRDACLYNLGKHPIYKPGFEIRKK